MFFQKSHGHVDEEGVIQWLTFVWDFDVVPRKSVGFIACFHPVFFECYPWRISLKGFNFFEKSHKNNGETASPKLQFWLPSFLKKHDALSRKNACGVCFSAFFPKHTIPFFFGGLGIFPHFFPRQRYQQKHRGSLINIRKKNDRWGVKRGNLFQKTDTSKPLTLLASTEVWSESKRCMLDLPPGPQDSSGKWRFRLGFPTKLAMSSWWWLLLGGVWAQALYRKSWLCVKGLSLDCGAVVPCEKILFFFQNPSLRLLFFGLRNCGKISNFFSWKSVGWWFFLKARLGF